jgi:hypothetical protein
MLDLMWAMSVRLTGRSGFRAGRMRTGRAKRTRRCIQIWQLCSNTTGVFWGDYWLYGYWYTRYKLTYLVIHQNKTVK